MVKAFIMVKTAAGKSEELLDRVVDLANVREAHIVAGEYDIIIESEADEVYDVMHAVSTDIRGLDGVTDTKTYICLE